MKRRSSGSALLFVLLLLIGFSGTLFIIARSLRDSFRQTTSYGALDEAARMARSGIEEGLRRYAVGPSTVITGGKTIVTLDPRGEFVRTAPVSYQNGNTNYVTEPWRRGFTTDATGVKCGQITQLVSLDDAAGIDLDCPYYELEIRRIIAADASPDQLFRDKDLPLGTAKNFEFYQSSDKPQNQPYLSFANGTGSLSCLAGCWDTGGNAAPQTYLFNQQVRLREDVITADPFGNVSIPTTAPAQLTLRLDAGSQPLSPDALRPPDLAVPVGGGVRSLILGRPETYIVATGYSGGVRKRLVVTIPNPAATTYRLFDFTGSFTYKGAIVY